MTTLVDPPINGAELGELEQPPLVTTIPASSPRDDSGENSLRS